MKFTVATTLLLLSPAAMAFQGCTMALRSAQTHRISEPLAQVHLPRRDAVIGAVSLLSWASSPLVANAVDPNDLSRLKKGLDSVQYLLDNWDTETIDPNSGEDSPDRVRFFLGLRTTDHPLFQVEKLLQKAQQKLPDDADFEKWADSVEGLNSHIAKVNELAYTSSFGEYNPGGGKGQIRKYLLLAKEEVVLTRDSLKTMIDILKL